MALVVEDGTGKATSESYISVADADTYVSAYATDKDGVAPATWTGASTAVKENALRVATQWIDRRHEGRWKGEKSVKTQRLSWPRSGVIADGITVDDDAIPRGLTEAEVEVALLFVGGDTLFENYETTSSLELERVKVEGIEIEERYATARSERDVYEKVNALLGQLVEDAATVVRG